MEIVSLNFHRYFNEQTLSILKFHSRFSVVFRDWKSNLCVYQHLQYDCILIFPTRNYKNIISLEVVRKWCSEEQISKRFYNFTSSMFRFLKMTFRNSLANNFYETQLDIGPATLEEQKPIGDRKVQSNHSLFIWFSCNWKLFDLSIPNLQTNIYISTPPPQTSDALPSLPMVLPSLPMVSCAFFTVCRTENVSSFRGGGCLGIFPI